MNTKRLDTMCATRDGQVMTITLNRPEALNAGDLEWVRDLGTLGQEAACDPDARIVVIRGAGRAFCSGIDLKVVSSGAYDMDWFRRWEEAITTFEHMDKVTVAAIHGYCLGGGLQLALACDLRLAREDTIVGLPAALEGLVPGPYRLARFAGWGRARRLSLTGENLDARTAQAWGILDVVVSEKEFEPKLQELVAKLLSGPVTAQLNTKKMTNLAFDRDFARMFEHYLEWQKQSVQSADNAEAAAAYRRSKGLPSKKEAQGA